MTTTLGFDDHLEFHREALVGMGGAALGGAGWAALSSSPWAALQGAAVGLAIGLGALRGRSRWLSTGLGLLVVAGGLGAVALGAGRWGLAAMVAALAALHAPARRMPWAAVAGFGLGYLGAWAGARLGMASEISSLPGAVVGGLSAGAFGLTSALALAARHVTVAKDPVETAYRELPPITGEGRELVERGRAIWRATAASAIGGDQRALVQDGVLQLLRAADRLARMPVVDSAGIARRQAELDQRIEAAVDAVARDQYRQTRATLDDQKRYADRVGAARERIVARMHHGVTTLETFRLACVQLDATAAERDAADARAAVAVLAELGSGEAEAEADAAAAAGDASKVS
jgi:hypothetical protein